MIEFLNIRKSFAGRVVLDDVTVTVPRGRVQFIIGQSGAGKSVLTKHLVGLIRPDSGTIRFEGQDVTGFTERQFYPLRRRCVMVLQHSTLFDSLTLLDNVALPIRRHGGLGLLAARDAAMGHLAQVGLTELADRHPAEIGDGLRKRVAIARALALRPDYLILDEPTTGLDPPSARRVDALVRRLADETGVTALVVSHDLRSIFGIADRIVMLYHGRVRLDGAPEAFRATDDAVVRQFIEGRAEGPMETG